MSSETKKELHLILDELLKLSREVITTEGFRFTGVHDKHILQVFKKHEIEKEIPF